MLTALLAAAGGAIFAQQTLAYRLFGLRLPTPHYRSHRLLLMQAYTEVNGA